MIFIAFGTQIKQVLMGSEMLLTLLIYDNVTGQDFIYCSYYYIIRDIPKWKLPIL